ncbi:hypothetical protein Tcan_11096 [Toxocara canis]|uniref:Uncharacterized protein n=1 Tax=Toxocara canis TaxID=6265 RepID=A0A0B2VU29_TOXCA|nr:hypothetical protein Tcan_11096 [Toxocara canis]
MEPKPLSAGTTAAIIICGFESYKTADVVSDRCATNSPYAVVASVNITMDPMSDLSNLSINFGGCLREVPIEYPLEVTLAEQQTSSNLPEEQCVPQEVAIAISSLHPDVVKALISSRSSVL